MRYLSQALALVALVVLTMTVAAPSFSAPPARPTVLSAVVNVDGTLVRGVGAVSSFSFEVDGAYEVTFNRDVSQCTYVGGAGEANTFPADDAITIGTSLGDSSNNAVYVIEYDAILGYDSYSSGFHLLVVC
jgi:hypothetical protein